MSASKHIATSTTNQLGAGIVILAAFKVFQSYDAGGLSAISEADVALLVSGLGVIVNRIKSSTHKKLHIKKPSVTTL